jgi:trigger factor
LESKINVLNDSLNELEVSLEYSEFKNEIEKEVVKKSKTIQIQGFRKGKAPISIIKKMFGDALEHEASEKVANDDFWKQVKEKDLKPVGEPRLVDLDFKPGEKLAYKVQYDVIPAIDVKDYTGIDIEIPDFNVKDEEVESEIKYIKASNAEYVEAEVVEDKETQITVDLQRVDDAGNDMPGMKSENIQIDLQNPNVNADLIEKALGKKTGESFDFVFTDKIKVKDDEDSNAQAAEIFNYRATIKAIKKTTLPELSEELVKKITKDRFSSEAELREDIKRDLQSYYEQQVASITQNRIAEKILENNPFKAPRTLVHNMVHHLMEDEEEKAKKEGRKFDHHEAHHRLEKTAEWTVKWFLVKSEIAKKENIEVTDAELKELAEKDAEKTGISIEKLMNYYSSSNYTDKLLDKKLFDFLTEKNNIKKVDPVELSKKEQEGKNE